jgi:hypothetical protein
MNIFNRLVMILLIPLLALVVTVVLMVKRVWESIVNQCGRTPRVVDNLAVRLPAGVALAIDFVLLILFLLEICWRRSAWCAARASGGEVRLLPSRSPTGWPITSTRSPGDRRARASRGGNVTVRLLVHTAPVDVPTKADEIIALSTNLVREKSV